MFFHIKSKFEIAFTIQSTHSYLKSVGVNLVITNKNLPQFVSTRPRPHSPCESRTAARHRWRQPRRHRARPMCLRNRHRCCCCCCSRSRSWRRLRRRRRLALPFINRNRHRALAQVLCQFFCVGLRVAEFAVSVGARVCGIG